MLIYIYIYILEIEEVSASCQGRPHYIEDVKSIDWYHWTVY